MNLTQLELLFISLFLICLGVYYIGKKKGIGLLIDMGRRSAIIMVILMIADVLFLRKNVWN